MANKPGRPSLVALSVREDVINKSWGILMNILRSRDVPQARKEEIALEMAKRSIPQEKQQVVVINGLTLNATDKVELESIRGKVLTIE